MSIPELTITLIGIIIIILIVYESRISRCNKCGSRIVYNQYGDGHCIKCGW